MNGGKTNFNLIEYSDDIVLLSVMINVIGQITLVPFAKSNASNPTILQHGMPFAIHHVSIPIVKLGLTSVEVMLYSKAMSLL